MRFVRAIAVIAILASSTFALGCSGGSRNVAPSAAVETLRGTVTAIQDARASDGGIDLTVQPASGAARIVYLESLYNGQPKPQSLLDLHAAVSKLVVGDEVLVAGVRTDHGLLLASLTPLRDR